MRDENPLYWTIRDLRRPEPECPMPEPIRPPDSVGVYFTCPHCGVTFMLVQQIGDDGVNWDEIWVNSHDHAAMVKEQFKRAEEPARYERYTAFDFRRRII